MLLSNKKLFLLDLDGVLYVGKDKPKLTGGLELIRKLRQLKKKVLVLTNSSTDTREKLLRKLSQLGFDLSLEEILSASYLTARFLKNKYGNVRFFLVGEPGFRAELEAAGHEFGEDRVDVVVVGIDRRLTYDKLDLAFGLLKDRARLVASHTAKVYMSDTGPRLAPGPIVKALEFASGKRAVSIGKPSSLMFQLAMQMAGVNAEQTVMVGDQIETDIIGAQRLGIFSILTLTGVEDEDSVRKSKIAPDLLVRHVDQVVSYLG